MGSDIQGRFKLSAERQLLEWKPRMWSSLIIAHLPIASLKDTSRNTHGWTLVSANAVTVFRRTTRPSRALPFTIQYGTPIFLHSAGRYKTIWKQECIKPECINTSLWSYNGTTPVKCREAQTSKEEKTVTGSKSSSGNHE